MTTADTYTVTVEVVHQIALAELHESPFNQRQRFQVDDLAASIRSEGRVLEPLLVRPRIFAQGLARRADGLRDDDDTQDGFEIVFGHRRLRAAEAAGLATVPCMVRALTDAQARSAQIAENLERDDVHPLEEAASFRALVDDDGLTPDQIAERYGKSRSYVYGRLKLLHLHPEVRNACLEGEVGAEVALLIARLRTEKLQAKALAAIKAADAKAEVEQRVRMAVFERIRAAAATRGRDAFDLQLAARAAIAGVEWTAKPLLAKLWGLKNEHQLDKGLDQMPVEQLTQLILDCALVGDIPVRAYSLDHKPKTLWQAAKHYGVDVAAVRAELAEPVQASAPATPPATPPAKKEAAAAPRPKAPPVKYRCADTGATWSGRGLQPAWVKAALANGRTLADLQATPAAAKTPLAALREAVAEEVEA